MNQSIKQNEAITAIDEKFPMLNKSRNESIQRIQKSNDSNSSMNSIKKIKLLKNPILNSSINGE